MKKLDQKKSSQPGRTPRVLTGAKFQEPHISNRHVGDFDVCGPAKGLKDVLENALPRFGCKLEVGEPEGMEGQFGTFSAYLGKEK